MAARREFWINSVLVPVGISVGTWLITAVAQYHLLQYQVEQLHKDQAAIASQQRTNMDRLTKVESWIEAANGQRREMLDILTEIRRDAKETRDAVQQIRGKLEQRGMIPGKPDSSTYAGWLP